MVKSWLIQIAKEYANVNTIIKTHNLNLLTKNLIVRLQNYHKLEFKNPRQRLQFIFIIALAYRSIYEYKLMINYLKDTVYEKDLKELAV